MSYLYPAHHAALPQGTVLLQLFDMPDNVISGLVKTNAAYEQRKTGFLAADADGFHSPRIFLRLDRALRVVRCDPPPKNIDRTLATDQSW